MEGGQLMHENAAVQHVRSKWIGKVRRAPDGDRAGAFYRNDTVSFYVVWELSPAEPHDEGTSYCTSLPGSCPVHDGEPARGWIPAVDLVRVT
jgi:hypothetical protein